MNVNLISNTPLFVGIAAIRKCYDSLGKSDSVWAGPVGCEPEYILGPKDIDLLDQVIKSDHTSTLEHLVYTFDVDGISRGCLQEFARHRIASLSVRSTRYTLGRIKNESKFADEAGIDILAAQQYLVLTGEVLVDYPAIWALEEVRKGAIAGIPNDKLKYCLPESFKTSLVWTINARSLRNFLTLRSAPQAHWEIRKLAEEIKNVLPESHKILFNV